MNEAAKEWLARAREDLETVERLLDDEGLTNIAAFHAQSVHREMFQGSHRSIRQTRPPHS
jgi:HEPN domain-containing protein